MTVDIVPIEGGGSMARIIVTTDAGNQPDAPVLLDERVCPEHLSDHHAAAQLIERLGWAVTDADDAERVLSHRSTLR
jgi:hypothetical protein